MNMEKRIKELFKLNKNIKIVISDLRFYNEYLMLKNLGNSYFININRKNIFKNIDDKMISNKLNNETSLLENDILKRHINNNREHSSENDISKYDIKYDSVLENNSTLNDLHNKVDNVLTYFDLIDNGYNELHNELHNENNITYYHILL